MRTPASVVAMWFIIFFSGLSLACLRWGLREAKIGGNKVILRTCLTLFVVLAAVSIVMIISYSQGKFSEY